MNYYQECEKVGDQLFTNWANKVGCFTEMERQDLYSRCDAQKLNESLTNIQIVTEASSEKMAQFAKEANKAAQALSTTTNTYAKAALIYYQQGLNDKQVKERTDLTIKMANVTGDTAKTVSEQLTAIWNNFDDGSRSLESYIDS